MEAKTQRSFRLGHTLTLFGFFLGVLTLVFSSVNAPRSIAFGTLEIITLSNQYRAEASLPDLITNDLLNISAQAKAEHMAQNMYFAHDAPDGTSPWYFFDNVGYSYITAGENLALTNQFATSVVDGWYNSPGHRANMLSPEFTEVGYGISFVPSFTYNGTTYANVYLVAAHYGKPLAIAGATTPPTPPAEQVVSEPSAPAPATTSDTPASQPVSTAQDNPVVPPEVDPIAGTSTSGTLSMASTKQPKLNSTLAYSGLSLGIVLVILGVAIETRRFLHHQPLLPHHN